jgi:hypothetical protein
MATNQPNDFGGFGGSSGSSSSGGSRSTKEYSPYSEGVANLIFDALQANGGDYHWPLNAEDAAEVHDAHYEAYDLPDGVTHYCIEQFAPIDIETEAIGTPVNVSYEQLAESVDAGYLTQDELDGMDIEEGETTKWAPNSVESTPQSDLSTCLNGFFTDEIKSRFGDGAKVRVMAAKRSKVSAAHERYTNVRYYVSSSKQAPLSRERARLTVGEIEPEAFEEWAEEHGFGDKL